MNIIIYILELLLGKFPVKEAEGLTPEEQLRSAEVWANMYTSQAYVGGVERALTPLEEVTCAKKER